MNFIETLQLLAFIFVLPCDEASVPHVSECNFCMKCHNEQISDSFGQRHIQGPLSAGGDRDTATAFDRIFPTTEDIQAKQSRPNCTECHGCRVQLQPLKAVTAFGQDFRVEIGASPEWIFTAELPPSEGGGRAVVKVWCMPFDKVHRTFQWRCQKLDMAVRANKFLIAQQRVVEECGLMDTTVKVWLAPVNAVDPDTGLHIWWYGLWMQRAEGISLNQLSYITRKSFVEETIMDLLQTKLNKTRVIRSAMLDLLTSQCDRHAQNVFINENGNIQLIDNLQAMKFNWLKCGSDSIFLPGTQKYTIASFGGNIVWKKIGSKPKRTVNPMVLLDYRCYANGGKIGTDYPLDLAKCLTKLSSLTVQEIMEQYGFPMQRHAEVLSVRAKDMLSKGFEWSLKHGEPLNLTPRRYKWHEPCCKLGVHHHVVSCGHAWNISMEVPKGDPLHGTEWTKGYPDPGTYLGGEGLD
ncbi:hypothetical protein CEUSTIGMA_g460.t1 [Chlamydomonas eustigma]|uniref:PI3K/PI4K catalytic domain-containing protein n=1 Tax=Chlamydomonas eustigma TaxID=1157962 RepID=A0A250WQA6_9CHLO|nr:hypothetical protein CEUSTIGMA_g460.t1 [Chlamydomonas eustigma]|eukprot:GAX73008.1 hypothetical protein CEUSTIGMA_g460.t1 [Chlamydomonas eustigma]